MLNLEKKFYDLTMLRASLEFTKKTCDKLQKDIERCLLNDDYEFIEVYSFSLNHHVEKMKYILDQIEQIEFGE